MKKPIRTLPLQHSRPVPCYTDMVGAYIMNDFGDAVYLPPKSDAMSQWAMQVVSYCTQEH